MPVFYLRSFAAQNSSRGIVRRGGITARGAAAGKGVFIPGKTAGRTAYRREKPPAMRTGFGVPANFLVAVIAEKTGFFVHYAVLGAAGTGLSLEAAGGLCVAPGASAFFDSGFVSLPADAAALPLPAALSVT